MSRKTRSLKRSIFLACEGQTEEKYFESIKDEVNKSDKFSVRVQILEIENGTRQDPLGLVAEALRIKNEDGYDEAWAIFDKDREPNGQLRINAFNFASQHGINIAFSSVAFEHWILLHFEKNNHAFERSDCESRDEVCECAGNDCICTYLIMNHLPEYTKGGSYKLYGNIKRLNENAVENCAWLKHQNKTHLSQFKTIQHPYTLNPHTDVDHLITKVLGLDSIIFGQLNVAESVNNLRIKILTFVNGNLGLEITNDGENAFVVNNNCDMKLKDQAGVLHFHTVNATQINPTETHTVQLAFASAPQENLEFRYKDSGTVLIVPL